jgi:hypothetical protein
MHSLQNRSLGSNRDHHVGFLSHIYQAKLANGEGEVGQMEGELVGVQSKSYQLVISTIYFESTELIYLITLCFEN